MSVYFSQIQSLQFHSVQLQSPKFRDHSLLQMIYEALSNNSWTFSISFERQRVLL
jgi:hypothetical protein